MAQIHLSERVPGQGDWTVYLRLLVTVTFWGSAFAASKVVTEAVPATVGAALRFGLGALVMTLILRLRPGSRAGVPRGSWPGVIVLGLIGVAAYNLLFFWGLALARASDGSMIIPTLSPAITVLLAALFLKDRLTWQKVIGLALAGAGSVVFFSSTYLASGADSRRLLGDMLFLGAALCWSAYTLLGKRVMERMDPLAATAYAAQAGAPVLLLIALPEILRVDWLSLGSGFWLNILYLAVAPTAVANWFWYHGVKGVGPARASSFMYLVPVSGLTLAALLLDDVPAWTQLAGVALMILGVAVINSRGELRASTPGSR